MHREGGIFKKCFNRGFPFRVKPVLFVALSSSRFFTLPNRFPLAHKTSNLPFPFPVFG